jgi:hypothetical protein
VAASAGSVSPSDLICGCRQCERVVAGSGRLREAASILAHADATAQPIWQMRMCSAENLAAAAQISEPLRCNHRATASQKWEQCRADACPPPHCGGAVARAAV